MEQSSPPENCRFWLLIETAETGRIHLSPSWLILRQLLPMKGTGWFSPSPELRFPRASHPKAFSGFPWCRLQKDLQEGLLLLLPPVWASRPTRAKGEHLPPSLLRELVRQNPAWATSPLLGRTAREPSWQGSSRLVRSVQAWGSPPACGWDFPQLVSLRAWRLRRRHRIHRRQKGLWVHLRRLKQG